MKLLRKIILTIIAVGIFLFGYSMMKYFMSQKEDPPQRPAEEAKRFVKAKQVVYEDIQTFIETSGRVVTGRNVALIAEVQGKILSGSISLKEGQTFKKGQLIYSIDSKEAAYNLSAQKSQFLTTLAAVLPDIKLDFPQHFDEVKKFFNAIDIQNDLPVLPDFNDHTFNTFIATKNILNQYYSIKSAEERLKKHKYYAPFDGTISSVLLEEGSVANPGTLIARIIHTSDYDVEVPLQSQDMQWVNMNQDVTLINEDTGKSWKGNVTRISDYLDPNTQSANIYVTILNINDPLYDGMYLTVRIQGLQVKDALEIPRKAIFNRSSVYIVEDGSLKARVVEIEKLNTETAIIRGLKEGVAVVTESVANAFENMPVQTKMEESKGS